jgi:hypothetical protein
MNKSIQTSDTNRFCWELWILSEILKRRNLNMVAQNMSFSFFSHHQLGPNVFIIDESKQSSHKVSRFKIPKYTSIKFWFHFWVQKTWIVLMMNWKNGSIVKVYWLIDPPLVIGNEMFFKRRQPQHFKCNKSYVPWTNEQSKVLGDIWFELIQKVTHKGLNTRLQTIFFHRH